MDRGTSTRNTKQPHFSSSSEKKRNLEPTSEGVGSNKKRRTSDFFKDTFTTMRGLCKILLQREQRIIVDNDRDAERLEEAVGDYFRGEFSHRMVIHDDKVFDLFLDPNKKKAFYDAMDMHKSDAFACNHPLDNHLTLYLFLKTVASPLKNCCSADVLSAICILEKENQFVLTQPAVRRMFQDLKAAKNFLRLMTSQSLDDLLMDLAYLTTEVEAFKTFEVECHDLTYHEIINISSTAKRKSFSPKETKLYLDGKSIATVVELIDIYEASWKENDQNYARDVLKRCFPNSNGLNNALQHLIRIVDITREAAEAYKAELGSIRD